mmetsp:Transcript_3140/g.5838  ORF Transcript_3140/g.5838 Transcript_3140/m.5838 type:complete len:891 (+) Transcript_3140:102-2774(+)
MKNAPLSIPPLPSEKRSKPISSRRGKENFISSVNASFDTINTSGRKETLNTTVTADDIVVSSMSTSTFSDDKVSSTLRKYKPVSNSASSPCITTPMRSSRVLRYNESIEDFFCLSCSTGTEGCATSLLCSEEHKKLCEDIANDTDGAANDLKKWNIALQVASDIVSKSIASSSSSSRGDDLIRLHKRAVSRFISLDANSSSCSAEDIKYLFEIWLSYANAQARFGSIDAARTTFRHIQHRRIGEKEAKFYIALAKFELKRQDENYKEITAKVIMDGIEKGAEPKQHLISYLEYLNHMDEGKQIIRSNEENEILLEPQKLQIQEPKNGVLAHAHDGEKCEKAEISSTLKISSNPRSILTKRNKLGGTRPSRGAFGGGAMRISALSEMDQTIDEDDDEQDEPNSDISYLLNWTPSGPSTEAAKKVVLQQRATKRKATIVTSEGPSKLSRPTLQLQPAMDVIEETFKDPNSSNSISNHSDLSLTQKQSSATCTRNNPKHDSSGELTNCMDGKSSSESACAAGNACAGDTVIRNQAKTIASDISKNNSENDENADGKQSPSSLQSAVSALPVHPDFLKIVCEKNILYVNHIPYVKLGVIGKGGSCKVYRTLSRDRNIVAIKKVKIAGMARKSIEGYANEIALLRRLRGNPAIIQLYDSEVDVQRKAIYLVMEPGEVDLNYVLQQQGKHSGNGHLGGVNMNFIRLTWQQMLTAVHCIHEERIIHGDLKPANFLFVKGVLKLIDFGIAKAIQTDDTTNIHRESQVGTLNYMSPESILDSGKGKNGALMKCGKPSDVWSLGCILYQMCYSKTPFADLQMFPKLQAIVNPNHEIEYPETIDPAAIDAMKLCLKRKPEERAPIVGKYGLLNEHWFLNSCSSTLNVNQDHRIEALQRYDH